MEKEYNKLDEVPLAELTSGEISTIKDAEERLGNKYYLIAFRRPNNNA